MSNVYILLLSIPCYRGWQYSDTLYKILKDYVDKFPDLFTELEEHLKKDMINASEIASKLGPEFKLVVKVVV